MMHKNRTSRISPLRRTLTVEALEERTLLTGNVTESFTAATGLLTLTGDGGNNQFTISPSPVAGQIRIAGIGGTTIGGAAFTFQDVPQAQLTDIAMNLPGIGVDLVTVTGFSIAGAVTITYANAADVFATPNFNATGGINLVLQSGSSTNNNNNNGLLDGINGGGLVNNGVPPQGGATGSGTGNDNGLLGFSGTGGTGGSLGGAFGGGAGGSRGSGNNTGLPPR
jgi:hypothetical protein